MLVPLVLIFVVGYLVMSFIYRLPDLSNRAPSYMIDDGEATALGRQYGPKVAGNPGKSGVFLLPRGRDAFAGRTYPTRVLWGDQNLHTAISVDAGTMCRLGQEDAYRFARGEEITSTTGVRARLSRSLDWLVIADHAEIVRPDTVTTLRRSKCSRSQRRHPLIRCFENADNSISENNEEIE